MAINISREEFYKNYNNSVSHLSIAFDTTTYKKRKLSNLSHDFKGYTSDRKRKYYYTRYTLHTTETLRDLESDCRISINEGINYFETCEVFHQKYNVEGQIISVLTITFDRD